MNNELITRARRKHTARELAERFGVSPRTIRNTVAEERAVYEGRANERRTQIIELARTGLGVRAIARQMEVDPGLVSKRLKEAREAGVDLTVNSPDDSTDSK